MKEQRDAILARARTLQRARRRMLEDLVGMRDAHRLTQGDVAARMGVSQSAVAQFERYDSNPTLATLQRYALAVEAILDIQVSSDREPRRPGHDETKMPAGAVRELHLRQPAVAAWNSPKAWAAISKRSQQLAIAEALQ